MPKPHRYRDLPTAQLHPTKPVPGVPVNVQVEHMRELRELQNQISVGYLSRDDRMVALVLSNTLSRADMAVATGLAKSRVDQIIRETAARDEDRRAQAARERTSRHLPSVEMRGGFG